MQASAQVSARALTRSGFILDLACERHDAAGFYQASCRFDVERYSPALFTAAGILLPEEIAQAVPRRQAEFLAGRYLAGTLLAELRPRDRVVPAIGIGRHRNPLWPNGVIGSITHCGDEAACVLASATQLRYLAIDREHWMTPQVCEEVKPSILTADEQLLTASSPLRPAQATTLIFSAKESLFKALYPSVRCYFGFECARLVSIEMDKRILLLQLREDFARQYQLPRRHQVCFRVSVVGVESLVLGRADSR